MDVMAGKVKIAVKIAVLLEKLLKTLEVLAFFIENSEKVFIFWDDSILQKRFMTKTFFLWGIWVS